MRCRKAEKTERVDEEADDDETKRYDTGGPTGELYTQHLLTYHCQYTLTAPPPRPARQQPNLFSSHLAKTHQRFTSNLRPISPSHVKGKSPIRPAPADVRKAPIQKYPSRQHKRKRANGSRFVYRSPVRIVTRPRGQNAPHRPRLCIVSFRPRRLLIRARCWTDGEILALRHIINYSLFGMSGSDGG